MKQRREIFQNSIRTIRKKRDYSQRDLAIYILEHKDQSQLSKWERGIKKPDLEGALNLAIALCTTVENLFPDYSGRREKIIVRKEKYYEQQQ